MEIFKYSKHSSAKHITLEQCGIVYHVCIEVLGAQPELFRILLTDEAFRVEIEEWVVDSMCAAIRLVEAKIGVEQNYAIHDLDGGLSKKLQQFEKPGVSML